MLIDKEFNAGEGTSSFVLQNINTKFCRVRLLEGQDTAQVFKTLSIEVQYDGLPKVIKFNGDSLTAGAGSTNGGNLSNLFQADFSDYFVVNDAIGGQTSTQILSRQGGVPIVLSVEGNALNGQSQKLITSLSSNFLSTLADESGRAVSGRINEKQVIVSENADNYSLRAVDPYDTSVVQANSVFIPNAADNYKNAVNVFWIGRNDASYSGLLSRFTQALNVLGTSKRFIAIGILPQTDEVIGNEQYNNIIAFNNSLRSAYPHNYVETLPPTNAEMAAIGYTPSDTDLTDISLGTFPHGMKADDTHLNNYGYKIIKNRLKAVFTALGY